MNKIRTAASWSLFAAAILLVATGCATKKYVGRQVDETKAEVNQRVDGVQSQVEANQSKLKQHDTQIAKISGTAQAALDRAIAAGKLAEGKFLYETVLTDSKVHFGFDESKLSDDAMAALDDFAGKLKSDNANVYVEIQGYTDSIGTDDYNMKLGDKRAQAVRRYLNSVGVPLSRMSTISYGKSNPIADNGTRDGRSENRRVVLVVLK